MSSSYSVRREESHSTRALGTMASLRLAKSLCDVTVQTENHQFEAHRVVLAASSAYFRAMFTGNMEESRQRVVIIRQGLGLYLIVTNLIFNIGTFQVQYLVNLLNIVIHQL